MSVKHGPRDRSQSTSAVGAMIPVQENAKFAGTSADAAAAQLSSSTNRCVSATDGGCVADLAFHWGSRRWARIKSIGKVGRIRADRRLFARVGPVDDAAIET